MIRWDGELVVDMEGRSYTLGYQLEDGGATIVEIYLNSRAHGRAEQTLVPRSMWAAHGFTYDVIGMYEDSQASIDEREIA